MRDDGLTSEPAKLGRIAAIDVARGAALVGMLVYHLTWDLANFGFISAGAPFSPEMRALSHVVASAFLALVGVSLALAHPGGLRRRAFARRFALIAGAALAGDGGDLFSDPAEPVYFGILHCIAVASLIAAPFLGAPDWAAFAAGVAALAAPHLVASESFNSPTLIWLGLGTRRRAPSIGARSCPGRAWFSSAWRWRAAALRGWRIGRGRDGAPWRSRAARWISPAATAWASISSTSRSCSRCIRAGSSRRRRAARNDREAYMATCPPACVEKGGELGLCKKACACIADRAEAAGVPLRAALGPSDDAGADGSRASSRPAATRRGERPGGPRPIFRSTALASPDGPDGGSGLRTRINRGRAPSTQLAVDLLESHLFPTPPTFHEDFSRFSDPEGRP